MAVRARVKNGVGMLPLPDVQAQKESDLLPAVQALADYLKSVLVPAINGRMSLGDASQSSQAGNIDGQWITYTFPPVANTEAEIPHGLGRVPVGYIIGAKNQAGQVYVSNLSGWGASRLFLKCNQANTQVLFFVF